MSNDVSLDINQKSNPVQTVAPPKEDNNMLRATDKITALYCRLSVEDTKEKGGKDDPSNSIQHQQIMLMEYAKSQHFPNPTFFIDDGYSGVDFSNRPGFQKMLAEIEAGHVEVVITKDLSRLGRNSSLTGLYINYTFPQYGVRYIAINDHFDTIDPNSTDSDMAGIKNWFNEWYSKDTSRKIRAVNKAKGERGERLTTNVPYGYKRDSDDPRKTFLYTEEQVYETDRRLYELEDYLKDHSFFRTSKTTIINLRRTKSIRPEIGARLLLTMDNQEKIIVSRQYAGSIKHALGVK